MAHGNLKGQFQIMNPGKLSSYYLQPIPAATLLRCGLSEEYRNVPKLSYIVVVCLSLLNDLHPGYRPAMSDADQRALAENLMKRLCLENPLHHNIWPVDFDGPRSTCRGDWSQTTIGALWSVTNLGIPRLTNISQLSEVIKICSGNHILKHADRTYVQQRRIEDQNLTREETLLAVSQFPDDHPVEILKIEKPSWVQDPYWCPPWWDSGLFGAFRNILFVRSHIPSSYRSMSNERNGHWVVFGFGDPSDRLGFEPPFNRLLMWRCFSCPALNGSMSLDRHLACLLKGLSFKDLFRSVASPVNLLNTVAPASRLS